jgi:hypothetical protein
MKAQNIDNQKAFHTVMLKFEKLTQDLQTKSSLKLNHVDLENQINQEQLEISRLLLEESIRLRGSGDIGLSLVGSDNFERTHKRESDTHFKSIFGIIEFSRVGYSAPGSQSLFPLDGNLNLAGDSYSLNLRRILGNEVAKDSFSEAIKSVESRTSILIPKRQAEDLSKKASCDFDVFYERRLIDPELQNLINKKPILVLTTDGKGIVMRSEDLREATKKRAEASDPKLEKRLSKGEKRNAKRMAQVGSVYNIDRNIRSPDQVAGTEEKTASKDQPRPVGKRVWASVEKDQAVVIEKLFDEAESRDPDHKMEWVVLIDGQLSQLANIKAESNKRRRKVTIIIDIIHVIEYIWKAARCFFEEGDYKAEKWVTEHLLSVLKGKAKIVGAAIRRSATFNKFKTKEREPIDKCADYLNKNEPFLEYNKYLQSGYPIATGVIEGACRHLVKDRMDITGARWSLKGAEAILKLRSLHASGDLDEYWDFHQTQEQERNHESKYLKPAILRRKGLKLVK